MRIIFWDESTYAVGWFQEGLYNGYWKRMSVEDGKIKFEGLIQNDFNGIKPTTDKDVPKSKISLYTK